MNNLIFALYGLIKLRKAAYARLDVICSEAYKPYINRKEKTLQAKLKHIWTGTCRVKVIKMRLDKFLKNSRIIKRRTVAKDACEGEKVYINGKQAKPSAAVKIGDVVEIVFGERSIKAEVLDITDKASKEAAKEMYRIIE